MIHGINNQYLYAVTKLNVTFANPDIKETVTFQGTGFFVLKNKEVFLITNRHILDIAYTEENRQKYPGYTLLNIHFDTREFDGQQKKIAAKDYLIKYCKIGYGQTVEDDIACVYDIRVEEGETPEPVHIPYDMLAASSFIEDKLSACDFVALIGFPANVVDAHNNMPILRSGVISSDPRLEYNYRENFAGHIIAYEAFSTGGASGSPVFALQKGFPTGDGIKAPDGFYRDVKVIGINAANLQSPIRDTDGNIIAGQHQQISLMYKADQIRELIDCCEKKMLESEMRVS